MEALARYVRVAGLTRIVESSIQRERTMLDQLQTDDETRLRGGTDDQVAVREPGPPSDHECDVCMMGDVTDPGTCAVELCDPGRNWMDVLGKDILHLCEECALHHSGNLLARIKRVLGAA